MDIWSMVFSHLWLSYETCCNQLQKNIFSVVISGLIGFHSFRRRYFQEEIPKTTDIFRKKYSSSEHQLRKFHLKDNFVYVGSIAWLDVNDAGSISNTHCATCSQTNV
jgi:hypothetical protein